MPGKRDLVGDDEPAFPLPEESYDPDDDAEAEAQWRAEQARAALLSHKIGERRDGPEREYAQIVEGLDPGQVERLLGVVAWILELQSRESTWPAAYWAAARSKTSGQVKALHKAYTRAFKELVSVDKKVRAVRSSGNLFLSSRLDRTFSPAVRASIRELRKALILPKDLKIEFPRKPPSDFESSATRELADFFMSCEVEGHPMTHKDMLHRVELAGRRLWEAKAIATSIERALQRQRRQQAPRIRR